MPAQARRTLAAVGGRAAAARAEWRCPRRHIEAMAAPARAPPMWAALSMRPPLALDRIPKRTRKPSHLAIACVSGPRQPETRQPTTSAAAITPEIAPDAPTLKLPEGLSQP